MGDHLCGWRWVVPVVHRKDPRPSPRAATSAGGDDHGRCLWTHRVKVSIRRWPPCWAMIERA
jgi:hypothetical protein